MKTEKAKQEFEHYLKTRGTDLQTLEPSAGVEAMLAFYRDVRVDGCDLEQSGDMLLYQWGTYDWGLGPRFEFDVTRQLVLEPGEDENIWQLGLTFRFPPNDTLRALGSGDKWCPSPAEEETFSAFVRAHPAYAAVSTRTDAAVELRFEEAG